MGKIFKIIGIITVVIIVIAVIATMAGDDDTSGGQSGGGKFNLGDTFTFDNLEITLGTNIEWSVVVNQFSDKNGSDVIKLPITVKNLKDETHGLNMFYFTFFGPDGTKLDSVSSFFMDDSIDFAGDMRSGAIQNAFMYILYDGNGDYFVEFSMLFGNTIEVKVPIQK
jgi:hypothetical protein